MILKLKDRVLYIVIGTGFFSDSVPANWVSKQVNLSVKILANVKGEKNKMREEKKERIKKKMEERGKIKRK